MSPSEANPEAPVLETDTDRIYFYVRRTERQDAILLESSREDQRGHYLASDGSQLYLKETEHPDNDPQLHFVLLPRPAANENSNHLIEL